jgi:hypothetical protein
MTDGDHASAGNVMLEDTYERHVLGDLYADERLGLYVIRGENMVLLGELVRSTFSSKPPNPPLPPLFFSANKRASAIPPSRHPAESMSPRHLRLVSRLTLMIVGCQDMEEEVKQAAQREVTLEQMQVQCTLITLYAIRYTLHSTFYTQHTTYNIQHTTHNTQHPHHIKHTQDTQDTQQDSIFILSLVGGQPSSRTKLS